MFRFLVIMAYAICVSSLGLLNITLRKSLNERVFDFPPPPSCKFTSSKHPKQLALYVSSWIVDESVEIGTGTVGSLYEITTSCTYYFFGAQVITTLSKELLSCDEQCRLLLLGKPSRINNKSTYTCKWPTTMISKQLVVEKTQVSIHLNRKGSVWTASRYWRCDVNTVFCRSGNLAMVTDIKDHSLCPLKLEFKAPGVYSTSYEEEEKILVAVPSKNLLFSISDNEGYFTCGQHKHVTVSSNGYLLTFEGQLSLERNFTKNYSWLVPSIPSQDSYLTGQINYYFNQLINLHNKEQDDLSQLMCHVKEELWHNAILNNNTDSLVNYITGDLFATSKLLNGQLHINTTVPFTVLINPESFKILSNGLIQINVGNRELSVEPISGLISSFPSRYPHGVSWLPLGTSGYIDLKSKTFHRDMNLNHSKIHYISIDNNNLPPESMIPDKQFVNLQSEIISTSIIQDFANWWEDLTTTIKMICSLLLVMVIILIITFICKNQLYSCTGGSIFRIFRRKNRIPSISFV